MTGGAAGAEGRSAPHRIHRLVLSEYHRGSGLLDRVAGAVNVFIGSMWVFVAVTVGIVVWLFAGNIVGFEVLRDEPGSAPA